MCFVVCSLCEEHKLFIGLQLFGQKRTLLGKWKADDLQPAVWVWWHWVTTSEWKELMARCHYIKSKMSNITFPVKQKGIKVSSENTVQQAEC